MSESWIVYSIEKEDYKLEIYGIYTTQEQAKVHILDILNDFIEDDQQEDDQYSLYIRHNPPNIWRLYRKDDPTTNTLLRYLGYRQVKNK